MRSIEVTDRVSGWGFEKINLSPQEFTSVKNLQRSYGKKFVGWPRGLLYPIRTNTLANFSKDFFLPTTVNHALRINDIAGQILRLFTLFLDISTFPLRVVTCLPRIIQNWRAPDIPLLAYLRTQNALPALLAASQVKVVTKWQAPYGTGDTEADIYIPQRTEITVNFIEMPSC